MFNIRNDFGDRWLGAAKIKPCFRTQGIRPGRRQERDVAMSGGGNGEQTAIVGSHHEIDQSARPERQCCARSSRRPPDRIRSQLPRLQACAAGSNECRCIALCKQSTTPMAAFEGAVDAARATSAPIRLASGSRTASSVVRTRIRIPCAYHVGKAADAIERDGVPHHRNNRRVPWNFSTSHSSTT